MTKDEVFSQVSELVSDGAGVGTRTPKAHSPVSGLWFDRKELLGEGRPSPGPNHEVSV